MASNWQNLLDRFSGSSKSTTSSSKNTSTSSSAKSTSGSNWQETLSNFSGSSTNKKYDNAIAPVATKVITRAQKKKEEEKKKKRKWFESGLFEDGYDFGDISRTILGTTTDVLENVGSGIIGMGEKVVDSMAYIAPYAANSQFYQNGGGYNIELQKQHEQVVEQSKKDLGKFIAKDLYDEEKVARAIISDPARKIGINSDTQSVFGEKSDALIQSGGQLLATAGLSAVGVPWFLTTGVTSFGSEAENALNQGATYEQAGASATISAGAEVLSEKLSGGISFGGKTLDDALTKQIARGISNKIGRTFAKLGMDMVGEGAEEVFSQVASNLGSSLYKEESLNELLFSEEAIDEYIESFIGGAAMGGVAGGFNAVKSGKNGVDYTSGLTQNEQKVVDKLYKDEVADREKEGKVTQKEKAKIYDSILEDMEKGYISIETIEEVLGGEKYNQYKKASEWEDSLQTEFDTLNKMKQGDMTGEQVDRREALRNQLKNVKATSTLTQQRAQIRGEVMNLVNGSRLAESYNERANTGKAFEADVTQYDAKQQATIQKAIDSGILNNRNRTHEFVDIIAKISADKGVLFDFTNNTKLKESGFAVEGKQVNGFVTKDGITLNIDSPKAWQSTVGHEITHVLEGTELYKELQKTIFDYAEKKGELGSRWSSLKELYKDVKDADVNAELTADLVGEYLFTDEDFIKNLSTEHRNVFQKIYDEIKYLVKVATGSKEARELEKVKRAFDKAYKEAGKATEVKAENFYDTETKYSLRVTDKETLDTLNNQETVTTYKTMQLVDGKLYPPMASRIEGKFEDYSELGAWEQATEHPELIKNGNKFKLDKGKGQGSIEAAYNPYMHSSNLVLNDQFSGAYKRNNLVTVECEVPVSELTSGYHAEFAKDSVGWHPWHTGTVAGQLRNAKGTERQVLLSRWIKPVRIVPDSEVAAMYKELLDGTNVEVPDNVVTPSLLNELKKAGVKIKESGRVKYSLSDSDGKQLTKEQQDYFAESKMRDENGNLKVMYHGSQDAGFHVFDSSMSDDGTSFFFVDRNDVAASYSGTSETYEAKTIRSAEDMNNFLAEIGYDHYEAVEKDGKFELLENGEHVATSDTAQGIYEEFCWYEGVGEGDANYKVYLNLKNPMEVDAQGRPWNKIDAEFSQEVYDKFQSLTAEEKEALVDLAEWEDFRIFNSELQEARDNELASAYQKLGEDINIYDVFSVAADNFSEESLRENSRHYLKTRDYAQRAKEQGYDGVIFKNIVDNGGYSNGSEGASTVAIAFDSNQIKSVANEKPTVDPDIRYSLSEDSDGRKLSTATAKRFSNSKVVDEKGNLKAVYHGTASGEFTIFDKAKGSVEGDFGSGFYFTDNESDVSEHYEGGGPDFENKVARLAEQIEADEDIDYDEAEERARAELYKGSHKFEVYLNIENPAVVGETYLFDSEFGNRYNEEDFDDYDEYIAETEQAVADAVDEIIWEVEKKVDVYSTDGLADVIYEAYYEGGIGIEELKDRINQLYLEDNEGNFVGNEVVRQIIESLGYDGIIDPTVSGKWNMNIEDGTTHYIVFKPNQIKAVTNQNPTDNPDIHRSLSNVGEQHTSDSLSALRLDAPVAENATTEQETQLPDENTTVTAADMQNLFPDDLAPVQAELEDLISERDQIYKALEDAVNVGSVNDVGRLAAEYEEINSRIKALEGEESERAGSITDADAPPEMEAPLSMKSENYDPWANTSIYDITRSTRNYSDRNPGVRRFLEEAALGFGYDVNNSTHGEKWYNDELYYASGGEQGFGGTSRHTTSDIEELKDAYGYTWEQMSKAADDVARGEVRSVAAKRVELLCHKRLMEGYTDVDGRRYEPNQEYITFLNETFADEQRAGNFDNLLENADQYAPPAEDVAPVKTLEKATPDNMDAPIFEEKSGQTTMFAPDKKTPSGGKTANVLVNEPKTPKRRNKFWSLIKEHVLDNGMVFEDYSKETGNREIEAKWNFIRYSQSRAQRLIGNGTDGVKALKDIKKTVDKSGKTAEFYDYLYHKHNVDRMSLEDRFDNTPNKAVFGDSVTSEVSQKQVEQYEENNPEFMQWAEDVYGYMNHLRSLLVDNGVISQKTADLWEDMYPHYVPIRRAGQDGLNVNVPLDSRRTTVNNPVKRATGGNQDILPLFDTMAQRTAQTYKAIARNSFGIELKNQRGTVVDTNVETVDDVIDSLDTDDALLKPGEKGMNPTFTVFENGERVEFEITEDMYEAMKPKSEAMQYRNKILNTASNVFRGLTTQYSIPFMATNAIKDAQDVLINSQHPAKTYANFPRAWAEQLRKGKYYLEYVENGGEDNTYFDNETNAFKEDNWFMKGVKLPFKVISEMNNFIELTPRLSEYIASREAGRSIEVSMLDAARVTTNFAAGGDVTKFLNANGATFLNASVQGAVQQVRNIREAHHKGLMGYVGLATKFALAGLPTVLLNNALWDDDEDYEDLADYVKQDYYVLFKYDDGKFFRVPKGRTVAVIQNAIEQVQNAATGDDEVDMAAFLQLAVNNLAPNNPLENNIIAPIVQAATNKTWYGEDLVPSRLQDLPTAEQFDEKTDSFSKRLGETELAQKMGISPYQINYVLNQYSGGIGDLILPIYTPRAENGDDSFMGTLMAPLRDKFTTDSVINSQVVSDFYDKQDELQVKANSGKATEADYFRDLYMDTVGWELSDLYAQKREIQNSDMSDSEKYAKSRELQEQIVERMKQSLNVYDNIRTNGNYAEVGDKRFNKDAEKDKWYEIKAKNSDGSDNWYYIQEQLSHDKLGMSYDDYWNGKQPTAANQSYYGEYNGRRFNYDADSRYWYEITPKNDDGTDNWYYQKEQEVTKGLGISYEEYWNHREEYNFAYDKPGQYAISQAVGGYDSYKVHYEALNNWQSDNYISADKDANGNSISGSRKEKVKDYISGLDLDDGEKMILYRSVYSSKSDKRAYNMKIIDYLNSRDDINYWEMKSILEELDMNVDSKGNISW